ncbi:MAG: hypothetical protein ACE5EU_02055 [Paracoccaceae bacterium]
MSTEASEASQTRDWAGSLRAYLMAWGIPSLILIGAAFVDPVPRTLAWSGALLWMGTACLMNAHRCGRTHCSYTGPYYVLLIVPVTLHGFGAVPLGQWAWWVLGALILLGAKVIWVGTELLWGKYASAK